MINNTFYGNSLVQGGEGSALFLDGFYNNKNTVGAQASGTVYVNSKRSTCRLVYLVLPHPAAPKMGSTERRVPPWARNQNPSGVAQEAP